AESHSNLREARRSLAMTEEDRALRQFSATSALKAAASQRDNLLAELGFVRAALTAQRERLATMEASLGRMQTELPHITSTDENAISRLQNDLETALNEWTKAAAEIDQERH